MKIDVQIPEKVNKVEKLEYGDTIAAGRYYYLYCFVEGKAHFIALDTGNRWDGGIDSEIANTMTLQDWKDKFKKDANQAIEKIKLKVVLND